MVRYFFFVHEFVCVGNDVKENMIVQSYKVNECKEKE